MKKVLVTGSKGQLGREIQLLSGEYKDIEFLFHDIDTLDLTDYLLLEEFFNNNKPCYLVNCAAYTAVDKAEKEKETAFKLNAELPGKLAELCHKFNIKLIHISTDYVFDGMNCRPYNEEDLPNPQSVYALSKYEGEQAILEYSHSIIIRTSWLYSTFGNNFVKTMLGLGESKDKISVVFDQIGTPTYARDLADVILKIINSSVTDDKKFISGIYHYSNEGVCSWYDFAFEIMDIAGNNCKVFPILSELYPQPAKRPLYSVLNKNKIKSAFNIEIPHWKDSLQKYFSDSGSD